MSHTVGEAFFLEHVAKWGRYGYPVRHLGGGVWEWFEWQGVVPPAQHRFDSRVAAEAAVADFVGRLRARIMGCSIRLLHQGNANGKS